MIIVDNALKAREAEDRPIRVASIGAGFMGQGLTNQIMNSVPGMRIVAAFNRRGQRALDMFAYAGGKTRSWPSRKARNLVEDLPAFVPCRKYPAGSGGLGVADELVLVVLLGPADHAVFGDVFHNLLHFTLR